MVCQKFGPRPDAIGRDFWGVWSRSTDILMQPLLTPQIFLQKIAKFTICVLCSRLPKYCAIAAVSAVDREFWGVWSWSTHFWSKMPENCTASAIGAEFWGVWSRSTHFWSNLPENCTASAIGAEFWRFDFFLEKKWRPSLGVHQFFRHSNAATFDPTLRFFGKKLENSLFVFYAQDCRNTAPYRLVGSADFWSKTGTSVQSL